MRVAACSAISWLQSNSTIALSNQSLSAALLWLAASRLLLACLMLRSPTTVVVLPNVVFVAVTGFVDAVDASYRLLCDIAIADIAVGS